MYPREKPYSMTVLGDRKKEVAFDWVNFVDQLKS